MSDHPQPAAEPPDGPRPDPAAPPPGAPDGTGEPAHPISAQPWSAPSGDLPPQYAPGSAPLPPQHPQTAQFPPINYAPPGQAPHYGYPAPSYAPGDYQVPPGYPGYPQPAPARRSNTPLIAVIIAVALLLCGGLATTGVLVARTVRDRANEAVKPLTEPTVPDLPTAIPTVPGLPGLPTDDTGRQIKVTYQVTGDGPAELLYLDRTGSAPARLDNVKLPWTFSTTMQTPALVSIIAMRADTTDGQITCRALVDGKQVRTATSADTALATAACTYFALD